MKPITYQDIAELLDKEQRQLKAELNYFLNNERDKKLNKKDK